MWRTLREKPIEDIVQWVRENASDGQVVHVGTDSLQTGKYTQFVTVVALLTPGKGGRAAYSRLIMPRITSLRQRLLKEAWLSVELGMKLSNVIPGELSIHLDANPSEKHMSNKYVQELVGLAVSQGFKAVLKPDAWVASSVADHIVRHKGKIPREVAA